MQLTLPRIFPIKHLGSRLRGAVCGFRRCSRISIKPEMVKVIVAAMAIAFVAVAVHGAAVPAELEEPGKAARAACFEETGATEEMIKKAEGGDFVDDEKLKCYFKCVLDKFTLIDEDKINFEAMLALVPSSMKEQGTKVIEACRETSGADLCEISYNFNKCLYKESPEAYFVI